LSRHHLRAPLAALLDRKTWRGVPCRTQNLQTERADQIGYGFWL